MKWKKVTEERYDEMLNILPPALWTSNGFLVGEAWMDKVCEHSKIERASYACFIRKGGEYFEGLDPMTLPEFRHLDLSTVKETAD